MMVVLLMAGIGLLVAGLLTAVIGIQLELSFGNTLILTGAIAACTGAIMLSLWTVARELKNVAWRLGAGVPTDARGGTTAAQSGPRNQATANGGFLFTRDQRAAEDTDNLEAATQSSAPWQQEAAARDRVRDEAASTPEPVEAAPAVKPRRNLLFSSSSRKERERAQGRPTDPSAVDLRSAPPPPEPGEVPAPSSDNGWPQPERSRAVGEPPRRSGRAPSTFTDATAGAADRSPAAARNEDRPPVTILKSGTVDGMAYSLYSDGSIEAQMPEGMMRFASIDDLRIHLDQRP